MNSIISFLIVLGLLIFVHELGHFIFAKLFGVRVIKFSLGFGPELIGKDYGETRYLISAFPLGGYVKMLGEQPTDEIAPEEQTRSFAGKAVWQRFLIVAAGPIFNLLFAVFLFFAIFAISGLPESVDTTQVGQVANGSAAETAGIKIGDIILAINGQETKTWEDVSDQISAGNGNVITLSIKRGEEILELSGQPTIQPTRNIFGEETGERYIIGITRTDEIKYKPVSIGTALMAGFSQTWTFIYLTIMGIVKMVQSVIPASELGGPILIAQLAGKQMAAGWINLFYFIGLISVNLGILNLFPIPVLDGGHLFFFSLEAILRKPVSRRFQEICQQAGIIVLATLMAFVFYNDIARLFKG
ncbi:MAG: RIP metalloprotease RseP [Proteobacteria bacterium]|nr:RIP metalloprotease RseP [Pseudomonadota bacterium]MBU1715080.1 RIP metalloprotease RseP [Pseudomonadota bacterium]